MHVEYITNVDDDVENTTPSNTDTGRLTFALKPHDRRKLLAKVEFTKKTSVYVYIPIESSLTHKWYNDHWSLCMNVITHLYAHVKRTNT